MRTLTIAIVVILASAPTIFAESHNTVKIGRIWFEGQSFGSDTAGGSDCWGYTAPDGTEYALVGTVSGIGVVNALTMDVVDFVPGPTSGDFPYKHRDIKTYRHYAYAVAEMTGSNDGLMIMDMQYLPDSVHLVGSYHPPSDITSHNFSIDTTNGYAYILKSNYTGFRIVSLQDPENPVDVNTVTTPNIHDVYARNDTVWVAEGYSPTFSMYDVSNKNSPSLILRQTIPAGGYSHNIWPTDDGHYAITTEETANKTVKIWDVTDPGNVTLAGEYLGPNNLAHNVHVKGNLVYISHYESGVTVIDISDVSNPVEIAAFDTFPRGESSNFRGCWGAYPFTQNGYFFASDIEGYLTVLRLDTTSTIPCEDITSFQARCITGSPFTLQFRINLLNNIIHSGENVTFDVDGTEYVTAIFDNGTHSRAQILLTGQSAGSHTISLVDPPACFPAAVVTCGAENSGGEWDATDMIWDDQSDLNRTIAPPTTRIMGNYPNPFNPSTTIRYQLAEETNVSVKVFNMLGQEVATLVNGVQKAGEQSVVWHGTNDFGQAVSSGLYVYKIQAGNLVMAEKMLLLH